MQINNFKKINISKLLLSSEYSPKSIEELVGPKGKNQKSIKDVILFPALRPENPK